MVYLQSQCVDIESGVTKKQDGESPCLSTILPTEPPSPALDSSSTNSSIKSGINWGIGVLSLVSFSVVAIILVFQISSSSNHYDAIFAVEHAIAASHKYAEPQITFCRKFLLGAAKLFLGVNSNSGFMNKHGKRTALATAQAKVVRECKNGKPIVIPKLMTCSQMLAQWYNNLAPSYVAYNGGSPCGANSEVFPKGTQLCIP